MKPFRFSLQPLRGLREQKEQKAQQAFGEALRLCNDAALQLQAANDELVSGWNSLCRDLSGTVDGNQLARTRAWCDVLELRQKERADSFQRAQRAMDAAMRQMLLATRDRETLDKHHDKSRRAYERLEQREEQKALDEFGVRRPLVSASFTRVSRI